MPTVERAIADVVHTTCCMEQKVPQEHADGTTSWEIASGLLYPEDILDNSPYLFSELPGRMTGAFNYNAEPLSVTVCSACCT